MDVSLQFVLKYPLIRVERVGEAESLITGKISIHNIDYDITIKQKHDKYLIKSLDKRLSQRSVEDFLLNKTFASIEDFLDQIVDLLNTLIPFEKVPNYCKIYRAVLQEYSEFTRFFFNLNACKLSEDLSFIEVTASDSELRQHHLKIAIDYTRDVDIFKISEVDLPKTDCFKPNDSLVDLFNSYISQLELLQPYFDLMDCLDRDAQILVPEVPKRADPYRRIWLEDNLTVTITVDPYSIYERPKLRFMGPEKVREKVEAKLTDKLLEWVYKDNVYQGILDLLDLKEFPKKQIQSTSAVDCLVNFGECSLCYSLILNEKYPEIVCSNPSCQQYYHNDCLYQWLVSLNSRIVFNTLTGNCPTCEKLISCPLLDKIQ